MKLSTTKNCLPHSVRKTIEEMYEFLEKRHDDGFSFFEEAEMEDKAICMWVLEDAMAPVCIMNWIQHGDSSLTRKQAGEILERIPLLYTFHTLKAKGLLDSIEGNDGREVYFLSEKGKEYGYLMGWDKKTKQS